MGGGVGGGMWGGYVGPDGPVCRRRSEEGGQEEAPPPEDGEEQGDVSHEEELEAPAPRHRWGGDRYCHTPGRRGGGGVGGMGVP